MKPLTKREYDVFQEMEAGKSNAEIAAALGMKIGTVKTHKKTIRLKQRAEAEQHTLEALTHEQGPAGDPEFDPDPEVEQVFGDPGPRWKS